MGSNENTYLHKSPYSVHHPFGTRAPSHYDPSEEKKRIPGAPHSSCFDGVKWEVDVAKDDAKASPPRRPSEDLSLGAWVRGGLSIHAGSSPLDFYRHFSTVSEDGGIPHLFQEDQAAWTADYAKAVRCGEAGGLYEKNYTGPISAEDIFTFEGFMILNGVTPRAPCLAKSTSELS